MPKPLTNAAIDSLLLAQRLPDIETLVIDKAMGFYNDACAKFGRPSGEL